MLLLANVPLFGPPSGPAKPAVHLARRSPPPELHDERHWEANEGEAPAAYRRRLPEEAHEEGGAASLLRAAATPPPATAAAAPLHVLRVVCPGAWSCSRA